MQYQRGLFPLSADPVTLGHIWLIREALALCEHLIILVSCNDLKSSQYLFTLAERANLMTISLRESGLTTAELSRLTVKTSCGLIVDAYLFECCDVIIRGYRNDQDLAFEQSNTKLNELILPSLAGCTLYVPANSEHQHISSSIVKAFAQKFLPVNHMVTPTVAAALDERLNGQYKLGVTGVVASGKTFVSQALCRHLRQHNYQAYTINFDDLVRQVWNELSPAGQALRKELVQHCGAEVLQSDGLVNFSVLKSKLFTSNVDSNLRQTLSGLTSPHVFRLYRQALSSLRGLILIEWAMLAEMSLSHLVHYRTLVVTNAASTDSALARGLTADVHQAICQQQWSADEKIRQLHLAATQAQIGQTLVYRNPYPEPIDVSSLAIHVLELFPQLQPDAER